MISETHLYRRGESTYLTPDYYMYLRDNGLLFDVSEGGLVVAPPRLREGIPIIGRNRAADIFLGGSALNWTFLLNVFALDDNESRVSQICQPTFYNLDYFLPYDVPGGINVLRVEPRRIKGELVMPVLCIATNGIGQVQRETAKKHLAELDAMNRAAWQKHVIEKNPTPTMRTSAYLARYPKSGNN